MTKTYKEILQFVNATTNYLDKFPEDNKLRYALKKVQKNSLKALEKYNELLEDLRIDHCSVDDKGIVLRNEQGNYLFAKDGLKALVHAQRELILQTVEIQEHLVTELPEKLHENYREVFSGFVLT